jgi:hypothetical protein
MKKLTDIIEAASLHPDALHVSPVKVEGKTKYQVKAVGKNFSDGIKVGEHLTDTHLDDASEMGAKIKHIKEEAEIVESVELTEGAEAHAQFQQYHNDSSKLLKGIGGALSKHYDNVTNKKGWNGGEANWNHVAEIKGAHRALQDLHDAILQTGEWHKPADVKKLKEEVEPEADMNILVQLRKPIDILEHGTQGGADITFGDGQKVFVEGTTAKKLVESMEKIKPEDRVKVAEFLYQSHDNMMAVYARLK